MKKTFIILFILIQFLIMISTIYAETLTIEIKDEIAEIVIVNAANGLRFTNKNKDECKKFLEEHFYKQLFELVTKNLIKQYERNAKQAAAAEMQIIKNIADPNS